MWVYCCLGSLRASEKSSMTILVNSILPMSIATLSIYQNIAITVIILLNTSTYFHKSYHNFKKIIFKAII